MLVGLLLTACGGDSGGGNSGGNGGNGGGGGGGSGSGAVGDKRLVSRIVTEGGGERTFQYDDQNRLIADSKLGVGNKIEYQGDDSRPSLVTYGAPYPTWTGYDSPAGGIVTLPILYVQYQYGEDSLFNSAPEKYYQTRQLDQNKKPFYNNENTFYRHYLNSAGREIALGYYYADTNFFQNSYSYIYDERDNLLGRYRYYFFPMGGVYQTAWEYIYDDKKSSASGMATPLWWFENSDDFTSDIDAAFSDNFFANPNNSLSYTVTRYLPPAFDSGRQLSKETYSYTYDQDGFPTAAVVTSTSFDSQGVGTTTTYRRTFEYIPAH